MTRVNLDAVADGGNTADGSVWVRRTTHVDGGVYTASTAFGGGGGSLSLSAGTSSAALGSVVFSNSNNVSFGLNGSTVTGSVLPPGGVSAGTASVQLGTVVFSNSNNVSFGLNGSTVTASATVASTAGSISVSAGTSSANLGSLVFSNSNGVSFGLNGSTVTASVAAPGGGGSLNLSAGTTSNNLTAVTFSNANGVSFGLNGSVVTASVNAGGGATVAFSADNGGSSTFQTLSFIDANGISWSNSNGGIRPIVTQSNQAASASNGSFAFQTLNFSNANNVTFGTSAGSIITASVAAAASSPMSVYAAAATNTEHKLSFINSNGITFGLGGAGNSQLTAQHNGLTSQSNQAASASNGSFTFQTLNFSNANNVTFGTSAGGIVTASVAAPGGGAGATVSQWPFVPWPIATSTINLGTVGTTGGSTQATASVQVCPLVLPVAIAYGAVLMPVSFATVAGTGVVTMGHNLGIYTLNGNTLSRVTSWMWGARVSQNSVTAQSWTWWYGTNSAANSSSRGGNVSATFAALADIVLVDKVTESLSAGQYWLVAGYTRSSSNAAVWGTVHRGQYSVSQFTAAPTFGSNTTRAPIHFLHGIATVTTNMTAAYGPFLPASLDTSIVTHTGGSSRNAWPVFKLTPVLL